MSVSTLWTVFLATFYHESFNTALAFGALFDAITGDFCYNCRSYCNFCNFVGHTDIEATKGTLSFLYQLLLCNIVAFLGDFPLFFLTSEIFFSFLFAFFYKFVTSTFSFRFTIFFNFLFAQIFYKLFWNSSRDRKFPKNLQETPKNFAILFLINIFFCFP